MPIHFEEVTGSIEPAAQPSSTPQGATPPAAEDDLDARLERALRLMNERAARLAAD